MAQDQNSTIEVQSLLHLLDTMSALSDAASAKFEPLLAALCSVFNADQAMVRLSEEDDASDNQLLASLPFPAELLQVLVDLRKPGDGTLLLISDVAQDSALAHVRPQLLEQNVQALALASLRASDGALGHLFLTYARSRQFSAGEQEALQAVSRHLAILLSQRRSALRVAALASERELSNLLREIASFANRAETFEDALRFAIERICTYTRWPLGHVFVLEDRDGLELISSDIWHCSLEGSITDFQSATDAVHYAPQADWSDPQFSAGRWRALSGAEEYLSRLKPAQRLGLASSYIVPVSAGGRIFAMLEFFMPDAHAPSKNILDAMRFVAEQLARVVTREETQQALQHSENMLGEAQRLAHLGSWEWEIKPDRLTWSDELYRIYGVTRETFTPTYDRFIQMVHPDDREGVVDIIQTAFESKESFDSYYRIIRGDGIVRALHARGYPIVDSNGDVVRMYGSGQDVTDRQQTEEALRKSEKSYRTLARNIPDALVALYDHDLKLTLVEGTISPFSASSIPSGLSLGDVLPGSDDPSSLQPFYDALEGKAQVFERNYTGRTFLLRCVPVRDEDGEIFAGIAMAQDISRNKEAQEKLMLRANQLSALHKMGQTVAASLNVQIVFRRVLETLRPLLGAEGVFILLCEGPETLVFAAANEVGVGSLAGQRVPASRGVAGEVIRTGRLQWLHGEETAKRVYHELQEVAHYHPRAIIAAPMTLHGELIGVMETVHSEPDAFGPDERAMMETAANWVAIAIGNARQHGKLQHQLQESEALAEISRALSQTLDLERILDLIVHSARDLMPRAESAVFFFLRREDQRARLQPAAGAGIELSEWTVSDDLVRQSHPRHLLNQALGSITSTSEVTTDLIAYNEDGGSLIATPVQGREGQLGLLSVHSSAPDSFTSDDHRLLTMLGRQAAMAVENARLFQNQQQARRAADTLRAANVALSQSLDLHTVLDTLLAYANELIGFDSALILLAHRHNQLRLEAARNLEDDRTGLLSLPNYPALQNLIDDRNVHVVSGDAMREARLLPQELDPHAASYLFIPLHSGEQRLGLLVLASHSSNAFPGRRATLAEGLAAQAAIAIQNARLFAEVQNSHVRLRLLSRQVVSAQEEERQRISRELHDEAGQALTALKISLEMMRAAWSDLPDSLDLQLGEAIEMTDQTMEHIRLLAHDLRPPVLDTFGLTTSIEGLSRDFGRRTGLNIGYEGSELPKLSDAVAISFYRFVQEALTNVARHAQATKVSIELRYDSDKIIVCVSDDGKGFDVDAVQSSSRERSGIGLMGMQDRFELLNGWIEIDTTPGQGTSVSAYVPYREDE